MQTTAGHTFYRFRISSREIRENRYLPEQTESIWHVTRNYFPKQQTYRLHIQMFRYMLTCNYIPKSEQGLYYRLALINDDVKFLCNQDDEIIAIENIDAIRSRAAMICNELRLRYKGEATENTLKAILDIYEDEASLIFYYQQLNLWGTLLQEQLNRLPDSLSIRKGTFYLPPDHTPVTGDIEYNKVRESSNQSIIHLKNLTFKAPDCYTNIEYQGYIRYNDDCLAESNFELNAIREQQKHLHSYKLVKMSEHEIRKL
ncbi:MAG: hypothetical protein LUE98_08905 [Tannerellaceae bacterium]|nr:hypothetical protein [Tannerellaceae bacterium]